MKTLYLDCSMGAAGDMLTAALYELLDEEEKNAFIEKMNTLGIPGVAVSVEKVAKCGILGTHMNVTIGGVEEDVSHHEYEHNHEHVHDSEHEHNHEHVHDSEHEHSHGQIHDSKYEHNHEQMEIGEYEHIHTHHHSGIEEIDHIIKSMPISDSVKQQSISVYQLIAEAESYVHGVPVTEIHFHEVGAMDAIADVTAVCLLIEKLGIESIVASPVHVGSGQVRCAHGILPVPAPATAFILKDIPIYNGEITGELCTPTGAALLKCFVDSFGQMPVMKTKKIGYGMGKKDFPAANCVRAMLGETADYREQIIELTCNVDDMTPERIGYAMECMFEKGALEVYTVPVGMKKSRPGTMICVMCEEKKRDEMVYLIFRHTTTLGIRENSSKRYTLKRRIDSVHTDFGDVRIKYASGYGITREKYEYDDLVRIAKEKNLSIDEIVRDIENGRK